MGYSAMIAQGRALSKKEKEKKANSSHDEMVSSLLSDLEDNPYAEHYGSKDKALVASPKGTPMGLLPSETLGLEAPSETTLVKRGLEIASEKLVEALRAETPSKINVERIELETPSQALSSPSKALSQTPLEGRNKALDSADEASLVTPMASPQEANESSFRGRSRPNKTRRESKNEHTNDSPNESKSKQSNRAYVDSPTEHTWTHADSSGGQSNRAHVSSPTEQSEWTYVDSPTEHTWTVQPSTREQTKKIKKTKSTASKKDSQKALPDKISYPAIKFRSAAQYTLARYLKALGSHITSHSIICNETGLALGTSRRQLKNFQDWGLISIEKHYGKHNIQGMRITVLNIPDMPEKAYLIHKKDPTANETFEEKVSIREQSNRAHVSSPTEHTWTHVDSPPEQFTLPLLDRKKESIYLSKKNNDTFSSLTELSPENFPLLSLSKDDIIFYWPNLAMIDFGESQIRQIFERLLKVGKAVKDTLALNESVRQGLTHADAALSMGKLVDHKGVEVTDPRAYIFRALARDGYYAAPKGYISPEAQKLRDEAEQARILRGLQKQRAEQDQAAKLESAENSYAQWRENLSAHQLEHIQAQAPVHAKKGTPFEKWLQLVHYPTLQN